jgi:hypothetical protein
LNQTKWIIISDLDNKGVARFGTRANTNHTLAEILEKFPFFEFASRLHHCFPQSTIWGALLEEQHLSGATCLAIQCKARWKNSCVINNYDITWTHQRMEVTDCEMPNTCAVSISQQASRVPRLNGLLGNQIFREVVVNI